MIDLFKQKDSPAPDVKSIRQQLLQFIKEQLQRWEGEGGFIKGMQLFIAAGEEDRPLYEAVVYQEEPGRFAKTEVQKLVDDYAIELPQGWTMETVFTDSLPPEAVKSPQLPLAFYLITNKKPTINQPMRGLLTILNGEAEQQQYLIDAKSGKICIGREKGSQTADGFHRTNQIAFPGDSSNAANKYISRQHAHIEWSNESGCFFLFADEGGIPPRNKVKVLTAGGQVVKLQAMQIGHPLASGDQIILGETALLRFDYSE